MDLGDGVIGPFDRYENQRDEGDRIRWQAMTVRVMSVGKDAGILRVKLRISANDPP